MVATLIVVLSGVEGMISVFTSKGISFIALMAALGNVLSFISIQLSPIVYRKSNLLQINLGSINKRWLATFA